MNALYIFTKDLRLSENKTLEKACSSDQIAFAYLKPKSLDTFSEVRSKFLLESIDYLGKKLKESTHELFILDDLRQLEAKKIDKVFFSKTYNSKDKKELSAIEKWAKENHILCEEVENSTLYSIENLPFSISDMPEGFSSFRRKIEKKNLNFNHSSEVSLPKPLELNLDAFQGFLDGYKYITGNKEFQGGEEKALERLHGYLWEKERAKTYKETRNGMLDFDDSTKFSPWLSLGCISPITIMDELSEFEEKIERNESTYWIYFELLWREYFKLYALKNGDKIFSLNGLGRKAFKIKNPSTQKEEFEKWKFGQTDEPFVNANMIELYKTGWMSNRGRQNVASHLSKHLCVDWRWGAEWFEKHLIDFDVESNWGNWNYNAGVGSDPRDRKFNIQRQADMYDPEGVYREKWLNS